MTGEVFNLMASHSILKDSITLPNSPVFSADELIAFKAGVKENDSSILTSLFKVRTNQLFGNFNKQQNALYLSGLLIGEEVKTLAKQPQWQLILCSGNNLFELYRIAMEELDFSNRTTTIPADLIDQATMAGQIKLAQNHP
jgi:2-dehydro-3-deoxygalactonokinase